ncbi:ABC transporter permease [Fulvivirga sedimenti]|uniref:ABC transporter permease n=1 Tax=Fulvivirga sedimenti TaxID=2879465 RepID=A0A9X1HWQ5_9BACT|nr:ABC transporter permease [Fulvivirga sedimenti]MCA6079221.1 ABC transporter permease [Fulvivirga sedimenti]
MIKKLTERFLMWLLHPDWADDITGDMDELYGRNLSKSKLRAELKYFGQALLLLRPSLVRRFKIFPNNNTDMFSNYFKIGTRNLLRHKLSTVINVSGLALGLAVFLLISEYVRFESTYDQHLATADNLYRVTSTALINGVSESKDAMASYATGRELQEALPEITNYTATLKFDQGMVIRIDDRLLQENSVISGDSNFFELFPYAILAGNPRTFLSEPNQVVLTKSKAEDYFGSIENTLGKTLKITLTTEREFVVTGVVQDIPKNTHYKFDMILSDPSLTERSDYDNWNYDNYYVYVLLDPGAVVDNLQAKLDEVRFKIFEEQRARWELGLVTDIHLESDFTFEPEATGNETAIGFLKYISFFILFIAWVNYINLSTARAIVRAKEVGLRKVVGAFRSQLISQFLVEALIINFIAAILAFALVGGISPIFNNLAGKPIMKELWDMHLLLKNGLIFFLIGTFLSGFYPAVVLSRYNPSEVLKGKFRNSQKGILLRKGLVIVQFTASILLITGTLIIQKQLNYMMSKDIGINTDQVISFQPPEVFSEETAYKSDLFKEELLKHNAVERIGKTSNVPGGDAADINSTTSRLTLDGFPEPFKGTTYLLIVDDGFIPTVDMEILAGRNFNNNQASDSMTLLVNESFLSNYGGLTVEDAIDKQIRFGTDEEKYRIIGVVKDFNRTSLKSAVEPTILLPSRWPDFFVLKLSVDQIDDGLLHLEKTWDEFYPTMPLDYSFLDARFASLYNEDRRFGNIFLVFSVLAIFIALLGLFGLASYLSSQRTKEVGIRKVLGASTFEVISLFVREFLILVVIAAMISVPLVFLSMESWLENYSFRIDFPWLMAAIGVLVIGIFAIATVIFQINKVARSQPADSLQYE